MDLNQIGLILNILGTLLIFRYGLPHRMNTEPTRIHIVMTTERDKADADKDIRKNKWIGIKAYEGITLIAIGFVLQFVFTFL